MVVVAILIGYILGSIPFGYIVGKLNNIDITKVGSGNIGFTNTWRALGFKKGMLVLLLDMLKGYLSAMIGFYLFGEWGAMIGAVACILGHTFSMFLHFKGGKGVACSAGVVLYLSPITFICCVVSLTSITATTKYMSLGSIITAILCPILLYITNAPTLYFVGISLCCVYIIYMHRSNIKRLLNGTENKIGKK